MIQKHTFINLAIAVIVPTVMFTIALLGIRYIKTPMPAVGKFRDSTATYCQEMLDANISLSPYLKFDSIKHVCDSAFTKWHAKKGRAYYVRLDSLFPNAVLKGLRAYTTDSNIYEGDFYCDGGHVGDSLWLIKNSLTGEYRLIFPQNKASILLGHPIFDLRDDLWHNLANYGILTKATMALLVSLSVIIISLLICHLKQDAVSWSGSIAVLLGIVWIYGYNISCGQDKFFYFPNLLRLYIALCWLGSIIALFISLEKSNKFFEEEQQDKKMQEEREQEIEQQNENEAMETQVMNEVTSDSK